MQRWRCVHDCSCDSSVHAAAALLSTAVPLMEPSPPPSSILQVSKEEYTRVGGVALCERLAETLRREHGLNPLVIPMGGSSPMGCWGRVLLCFLGCQIAFGAVRVGREAAWLAAHCRPNVHRRSLLLPSFLQLPRVCAGAGGADRGAGVHRHRHGALCMLRPLCLLHPLRTLRSAAPPVPATLPCPAHSTKAAPPPLTLLCRPAAAGAPPRASRWGCTCRGLGSMYTLTACATMSGALLRRLLRPGCSASLAASFPRRITTLFFLLSFSPTAAIFTSTATASLRGWGPRQPWWALTPRACSGEETLHGPSAGRDVG